MKLRKTHWSLWLIKAMTGKSTLPKSRCEYFRKLIYSVFTAVIVLPFTVYIGILSIKDSYMRKEPEARDLPVTAFVIWMLVGLFFTFIFSDIHDDKGGGYYEIGYALDNIYWFLPFMMVSAIVILGSFIGIIFLFVKLIEMIEKAFRKGNKNPRPYWSDYPTVDEYKSALKDWHIHEEYLQEKRESTLSYAIKEWWKTRKEKVCPIIEYTEEDGTKN